MPRTLRSDFAGEIYHALNRGNARNKIFFKAGDFEAFERVIKDGLLRYPVDLGQKRGQEPNWQSEQFMLVWNLLFSKFQEFSYATNSTIRFCWGDIPCIEPWQCS